MQRQSGRPRAGLLLCSCLVARVEASSYFDWLAARSSTSASYSGLESFISGVNLESLASAWGGQTPRPMAGLRLHFLTFSTEGFEQEAKDLCEEAKKTGVFVETHCFDTIPEEVLTGRWNVIRRRPGTDETWLWLPALTQYVLRRIPVDDIMLVANAGVELSSDLKAWNHMLEPMQGNGAAHIIAFQRSDHPEYEHTKGDVFREFGVWMDDLEVTSYQVMESYFFIRNVRPAHLFLNNWAMLLANPQLLTDRPSHAPNHEKFIAHGHESSLWSMLIKANRKKSKCKQTWKTADLVTKILPYRGCDDLRDVAHSPIQANCARQREGMQKRIKKIRERQETVHAMRITE